MNMTRLALILLFQWQRDNAVALKSMEQKGCQYLNKVVESLFSCLYPIHSCIASTLQFIYRFLDFFF